MSGIGRYPWWVGPTATLGAIAIRALGATWRIERRGHDPSASRSQDARRCIFTFWHSGLLPLAYTHRKRGVAVLISRHLDGEIVARALERLGFATARGSSTRGGGTGTLELLRLAAHGAYLGITPDGPRGPSEVVKGGAAYLASRSGLPIVPTAIGASRAVRLGSWDRMIVPLPFSKLLVDLGPPILVPPGLGEADLERWRLKIERALLELTSRVRADAGERP
ncbi:MAG: lysophospholipid acyltransferase family protein [Candidatus Eisenbacteria bacterium]|nr:lysophospholipid acyltransferase family protein [Candidatus Eisenbacteria bacterium]